MEREWSTAEYQGMTTTHPSAAAPIAPQSPIPPAPTPKAGQAVAGGLLVGLGTVAIPVALLGLFVTVNACGPFADSCSDYGKSDPAAGWFFLLLLAAPVAIVAGIVMLVARGVSGRRARACGPLMYPAGVAPVPGWYADPTDSLRGVALLERHRVD